MEKLKYIEKYIRCNKKLGFEGYKNIKNYFKNFNEEELNYIEMSLILSKESNRRLMQFRDIFSFPISMYALIVALLPDVFKETYEIFCRILVNFLIGFIIIVLLFFFTHRYASKKIDECEFGLEIIGMVKKDRYNKLFKKKG